MSCRFVRFVLLLVRLFVLFVMFLRVFVRNFSFKPIQVCPFRQRYNSVCVCVSVFPHVLHVCQHKLKNTNTRFMWSVCSCTHVRVTFWSLDWNIATGWTEQKRKCLCCLSNGMSKTYESNRTFFSWLIHFNRTEHSKFVLHIIQLNFIHIYQKYHSSWKWEMLTQQNYAHPLILLMCVHTCVPMCGYCVGSDCVLRNTTQFFHPSFVFPVRTIPFRVYAHIQCAPLFG